MGAQSFREALGGTFNSRSVRLMEPELTRMKKDGHEAVVEVKSCIGSRFFLVPNRQMRLAL